MRIELSMLTWPRQPLAVSKTALQTAAQPSSQAGTLDVAVDCIGEPPAGCGWFDSSHDLCCGLSVVEHASADVVASDLPLARWLDMHLAGWPMPAAQAALIGPAAH